ncbi:MAG: peptidyl-prolyl cis-trans isomerase [Candidatus Hydrogenedentes bacterium]|nr:peptidyl-prolyl cis-trans isomerase [Candidatus Hydrogenedentota bacterium]
MQGWMRKHRRIILVLIIVFIGVPFVIWVAPQGPSGPGQNTEGTVVATVGDTPIYDWQLVRALESTGQSKAREQGRQDPLTMAEMAKDGTANEVMKDLISVALFRQEIENRHFEVNQDLLEKTLREEAMFQDQDGKFDAATFNRWVTESRVNWNELYQDLNRQVAHEAYVAQLTAPAKFIAPAELDKQVAARHTKIKVKYAKIDPPIELTDEEVRAYFDQNTETYRKPASKTARFIAVDLAPPLPENAAAIVTQAREGADFTALVKEHSFLQQDVAAEPEWTPKPLDPQSDIAFLFDLEAGAVTDPMPVVGGYRIYKVLEKRNNETTGEPEIKYRDIYLRAQLGDEERKAREEQAAQILAKAEETGSLEDAAAASGLLVKDTGTFTTDSVEVEGLPNEDVRQFTMAFQDVEDTAAFKNVTGRSNLYVARLASVQQGEIPPFEDVQLKVRDDLRQARKLELPYKEKVNEYVAKIEGQAKSLEEIKNQFPELNLQIFESKEITGREFIFENNSFLQGQAVFDAVGEGEPGTFGGPVRGFDGVYFVELLQKTPPAESEQQAMEEDKKRIKENLVAQAENELLQDYLLYLNQQRVFSGEVAVDMDDAAIQRILGVKPSDLDAVPVDEPVAGEAPAAGAEAPAATGEAPATGAAAPAAGAAAPAAAETPAPESAPAQ